MNYNLTVLKIDFYFIEFFVMSNKIVVNCIVRLPSNYKTIKAWFVWSR